MITAAMTPPTAPRITAQGVPTPPAWFPSLEPGDGSEELVSLAAGTAAEVPLSNVFVGFWLLAESVEAEAWIEGKERDSVVNAGAEAEVMKFGTASAAAAGSKRAATAFSSRFRR